MTEYSDPAGLPGVCVSCRTACSATRSMSFARIRFDWSGGPQGINMVAHLFVARHRASMMEAPTTEAPPSSSKATAGGVIPSGRRHGSTVGRSPAARQADLRDAGRTIPNRHDDALQAPPRMLEWAAKQVR